MLTQSKPLRWYGLFVLLMIASVISACSGGNGVPDAENDRLKAVPDRIEAAREDIKQSRASYKKKLDRETYRFIKAYTSEQRRTERFDQAEKKLGQAEASHEAAKKIADDYADEKLPDLIKALNATDRMITEAGDLAKEPALWAETVLETKNNPDAVVQRAEQAAAKVTSAFPKFEEVAATTAANFPGQKERISKYKLHLSTISQGVASDHLALQNENEKPEPNFAVMSAHSEQALDGEKGYIEQDAAYRAMFEELSTTETHTLLDIKVDSVVTVERTSWHEDYYDEYPAEADHEYPDIPVDVETANYFAQFSVDQMIAEYKGGNFQAANDVDGNMLGRLELDPTEGPGFDGDDNQAEYYFGGLEESYCHKLLVLVDGEPDVSGRPDPAKNYCSQYDTEADLDEGIYWVEPDEPLFNAMGMDIYAKGYGDFSDQATTVASPPGMVYVGDPQAGEWREDQDGNSYWYYYGQYRFFGDLIGGPNPYHYRSEYNTWNGGHRYEDKPYYSGTKAEPRYGGASPMVDARFPNSNYKAAGLAAASVRGDGPVARAGGPGGGGK